MKKNYFETIIGTFVLFFSVYAFLMFLEVNTKTNKNTTSKISANFLKLGGIIVGNDVKLRGIKIGVVSNVFLDSEYYARVEMEIDSKIKLPRNSQISVQSEGILGNKYLSIIPGDDFKKYILNNGFFENVRDYESIEDQVSKIIFLATQ